MTTFSRFEGRPEVGWADRETCLALLRETREKVAPFKHETETRIWSTSGSAGEMLFLKEYAVPLHRRAFAGLAQSRALREWRALRAMHEAGLPVPEPLWFAESRRGGILLFSVVATRSLGQVTVLPDLLRDFPSSSDEVCREVGRVARRLHDAGFGHFRLRPKNLLIGPPPERTVSLLDVPYACHWDGGLPARVRRMDLEQLAGAHARLTVEAADAIRLGYLGMDTELLGRFRFGGRFRWAQKLRRIWYFLQAGWSGHRP